MSILEPAASTRAALCTAFDETEPQAPTLCEGWTAHHLAAHIWIRENEPINALGIAVPALAPRTSRRVEQLRQTRAYPELVAAIRRGPGRFSPFRLPGAEALANTLEFFVHCEDLRRTDPDARPRPVDAAVEAAAWRGSAGLARLVLRDCPVAVWLDRAEPGAEPIRIGRGPDIVALKGRASEIVLYLFGRTTVAELEVIGQAPAVAVVQERLHRL